MGIRRQIRLFKGLNLRDEPGLIEVGEAADMLNVTAADRVLRARPGLSTAANLAETTQLSGGVRTMRIIQFDTPPTLLHNPRILAVDPVLPSEDPNNPQDANAIPVGDSGTEDIGGGGDGYGGGTDLVNAPDDPPDDTWYVQPYLPDEIYLGCSFDLSLAALGGETGFDPDNIFHARVGTATPGIWAGYYPAIELAAGGSVNVITGWSDTSWSQTVVVTETNLCKQDISRISILIGFDPSLWDSIVYKSDIATLKYPAFQPALPETVEDGDVFDATISALDEDGNVLPNYVLAGAGLTLTWEKRIEGDWVYASVVQADDSAVDITTDWTDGVWTQSVKFADESLLFADKVRLTVATPCTEQSAEADCTSLTDAATGDPTPQPEYAYSYVVQFTLTYDNGEDPPESYDYTERLVVDEIDVSWDDISGGTSAFWGGWQGIGLRVIDGAVLISAWKYEHTEWGSIAAVGRMEGEPPPLTGERLDNIDIGDRGWELHLTNVVVYDY